MVDIDANPIQYVGIHVVTSKGVLTYEEEPSYGGNWWSESDFGVASGMGYATFDSLENIVKANPDLAVTSFYVLYTHPEASSSIIKSVTLGCVKYTFDKEHEDCGCNGEDETKSPVVIIERSEPCIPLGQMTSSFTVKVKNPNDLALTYRVEVDGNTNDDAQTHEIAGGETYTFTFSGYAAGTHTVKVYDESSTALSKTSLTAPLGIEESDNAVFSGSVKLHECPPPTDVCPNIPDLQLDDTLCPTPPVDVCPDVQGNQTSRDECGQVQGNNDVCPNLPGSQTSIPTGSVKDSFGNCVIPAGTILPVGGQGAGQILGTTLPTALPATGATSINPVATLIAAITTFLVVYGATKRRAEA